MLVNSIATDQRLRRLLERAEHLQGVMHVNGLWGSSAPMVTALIASANHHTYLYVMSHLEEADTALDDLELFGVPECELFPAWETLPGEGPASGEIHAERLRLCAHLADDRDASIGTPRMIVTPIQALLQPVPSSTVLADHTLTLRVAKDSEGSAPTTPDTLTAWAVERGFERLDLVESPGDVARRGDIVDLFIPGETAPVRIQFFDDQIESIRRFDVGTQRSIKEVDSIRVFAVPRQPVDLETGATCFLSYLPDDTTIILDGPSDIQETASTFRSRVDKPNALYEVAEVLSQFDGFGQLHFSRFGAAAAQGEESFNFSVNSLSRFEDQDVDAVAELALLSATHEVHVICDNDGERGRLLEILTERFPNEVSKIKLSIGVMHRGFEWTSTATVVVAHHELFHRQRQRQRIRRLPASRPIDSWLDLAPGDIVVHVIHGIAAYRGLKRLRKGDDGQDEEFLSLEFADRAMVHVPSSQVELVQKYIGSGGRKPQLSTLGGKRWSKAKERVAESVSELAESLLRVQALREQAQGTAYPADTLWQREFEEAFIYDETEDQLQVAGEIRADLMKQRPMDRLVCGDVGYGKTELAMRAAFKVIEYGRQVAVLVPTTVLAEQHYRTFKERMAEYPFEVGCLSRFRSSSDQKKLIQKAKRGQIDILIGTHRLLSKDVGFANLGLLVIDEEQRFGVEHKERLRAIRAMVDVLTLTATPIPRTLHMALMGIRDISSLQSPPMDRRAVTTLVRPFDRRMIREAILREMNRDGQVFFLHNFVQSIESIAAIVQEIVPEAKVVLGHGQMKDGELESVMRRFVAHKADVLVCTTIIESGIDIPSVNTIFINRADRFGLADLHQLRGRVGRSSHRAYCYLLLADDRPPTPKAAKRLKTIEEFSELGAGFRIAMRDLEIRGAGNLLGAQQSGHIAAVGYEMYCRLVEQATRRLRNEPDPTPPPVQIDLDVTSHIPQHYISAERSRIEAYRRIASCWTNADLKLLEDDLTDAFGTPPPAVECLLRLAAIRVHARRFGIDSISLRRPDVVFVVQRIPDAESALSAASGSVRLIDDKTIHWRPPTSYLDPQTLPVVLDNMLRRAAQATPAIA